MTVSQRGRRAPAGWLLPEPLAAKVPEITAWFWVVKILTTAAGEATSDALKTLGNIKGGGAEILLILIGVVLQFRSRRYSAVSYWFLAYAIATFGTGVADFLHLDVGIPYAGTTVLWAVILAAVFVTWYRSERTLSIHSITTTRRELFYWATVFATFALGTALGDFTASEVGLGYFASAILFSVVILVPAAAYRWFGMNSIAAFWFAYVVTRPLGASYADYISKPPNISGAGFGDAPTAILLGLAIVVCVAYLAIARPDAQVTLATTGRRPGSDGDGRTPQGRRHLGGWPPRPSARPATRPASGPERGGGGQSERFDPLLRDLHHQTEMHGSRPVYFDRVCAGCRRRRLTRQRGDAFLCDACLAGTGSPDPRSGGRRG